jgi:hypothetical protein
MEINKISQKKLTNFRTMSFQAYLDNIKAKTGKGPADFIRLAEQKGFLLNGKITVGTKAGDIVKWLKEDFKLGHGHAMAIYALFKGIKSESGN